MVVCVFTAVVSSIVEGHPPLALRDECTDFGDSPFSGGRRGASWGLATYSTVRIFGDPLI